MCSVIAKLPANASQNTVADALDSFKGTPKLDSEKQVTSSDDGVTPLMIACDKGLSSCLEYMADNKTLSFLWGSAEDRSSAELGSNTALHHAGITGVCGALISVPSIGCCSLPELLRKGNAHGDTPLMMACVYNRLRFLQKIQETLCRETLIKLLQIKNESGETALSLAMGHGHVEVVQWWLDLGVPPCYEIVQQCKVKQQTADGTIAEMPSSNQEIELRRTNMRRCLVMLQVALARISQDATETLLIEEEICKRQDSSKSKAEETRKQPNQKSRQKLVSKNHPKALRLNPAAKVAWDSHDESNNDQIQLSNPKYCVSQPIFNTLPDGTVVTEEASKLAFMLSDPAENEIHSVGQPKSADQMLRERLREPSNVIEIEDASIDAYMDTLCLDASMLLFNSHGMAMNLSPSQLEAIDRILHKQRQAVKDAQAIQQRLRDNTNAVTEHS
eukprot:CAMPEP_0194225384 /NCGR_PEP_ID=MMETSP0156-20130528/39490_1 /TAXON_ID=33649 /ORGANISM="Thalassionema nitzschioides, Strain L26-B" /LENGTH=445 /DNA_ID=CAMNT_0038957305 /DNA_START=149 /DNA_END=1486 /DNA_ORIENTATION=+